MTRRKGMTETEILEGEQLSVRIRQEYDHGNE